MIILEGPNGAGKSTLAQRMRAEGFKVQYLREYDDGQLWMSSLVQLCVGEEYVLDRCWITEAVYHQPLRLRLDQLYYVSLLTQLATAVGMLIPSWKVCKERRPELDKRIWDGYMSLKRKQLKTRTLEGTPIEVHEFLPPCIWSETMVPTLLRWGDAEKKRAKYLEMGFCGVGTMTPRVLLLGDRVNMKKDSYPLMPIGNTSCGAYMMRVLWHAELWPREVHLHNAFKPNGKPYNKELIELLKPDIVVALGERAHDALHKHYAWGNAKLARFHHPQYLRRFHVGEEEEYGEELRDIITKLS